MEIQKIKKEAFTVIGKEGSTEEGDGFIQRLWAEANEHFPEIAPLAKKDKQGNVVGIWGAMSDASRSFQPWEEEFRKGLYLAGAECEEGAEAPEGWTKWEIPGFEYLSVEQEDGQTFQRMLQYLQEHGIALVGAVQELHCPESGKDYLLFPVRAL